MGQLHITILTDLINVILFVISQHKFTVGGGNKAAHCEIVDKFVGGFISGVTNAVTWDPRRIREPVGGIYIHKSTNNYTIARY